jgi:uncharacterized protein (DUF2236 family)
MTTLPSEIRQQYGIAWSVARERGMERMAALSRRMLPLVPAPLRFAPQARAADRRIGPVRDPAIMRGRPFAAGPPTERPEEPM